MEATVVRYAEPHYSTWRSGFCDEVVNLDAPPSAPAGFAGAAQVSPVGEAVIVHMEHRSGPTRVARGRTRVRQPNPVDYGLFVVRAGEGRISADGRERVLEPGDVALIHRSKRFSVGLLPGLRLDLVLFGDSLLAEATGRSVVQPSSMIAGRTGLGEVLGSHLRTVAARSRSLDPLERSAALRSLAVLATATFAPGTVAEEESRQAHREAQLARLMSLIEGNLDDPTLRPARLAQMAGISVRYLHRLFETTGRTAGATIRARRLDRARAELCDPAKAHLRVTDIAFRWGFNDSAHFSRCFKARFGISPRDARLTEAAPERR